MSAAPPLAPSLPAALDSPRVKILAVGDAGVGKSCVIKRFCEGRFIAKYIPTIGIDFGVKRVELHKAAVLQQQQQQQQQQAHGTSLSSVSSAGIPSAVRVNFWDASGDDDYAEIRNEFYDSAQGILLCYDVRNAKSFTDLSAWWDELTAYCEGLEGNTGSERNGTAAAHGSGSASGKRSSLTAPTVTSGTAAGKAVGHNDGKAPIVLLCANKVDDTVVGSATYTADGGASGPASSSPSRAAARVITEEQGRAWAKERGCAGYYETSASTELNVKEALEDLVARVVAKFM